MQDLHLTNEQIKDIKSLDLSVNSKSLYLSNNQIMEIQKFLREN